MGRIPNLPCLLFALVFGIAPFAQASENPPSVRPDTTASGIVYVLSEPITVTATRTARNAFDVPRAITIVQRDEIARKNQYSALDVLRDKPGIWVEKRTTTTSDPVMRGMSGYNILALIDGNTLSTLWGEGGESGDDMYGKVDPDNVERVEVVRGPLSVLYGSNALAGVINFITKAPPIDYTSSGTRLGAMTKFVSGSAASDRMNRTEVYGATPKARFLVGVSFRETDDVRAGGDIGVETPTGGEEANWDLKGEFRPAPQHTIELAYTDVNKDDSRRFYRPDETNFNDRIGASLRYRGLDLFFREDRLDAVVYYQDKKDTRRDLSTDETSWARTKTYTSDLQWTHTFIERHSVTTGAHFERDDGVCPDDEQFVRVTSSGVVKDAPDSRWTNLGFYAQDEWTLTPRVRLTGSVRWDRYHFVTTLDSLYVPPNNVDPSIDQVDEEEGTLTGGLGLLYGLTDHVNLFGHLSRGFRQYAPVFGIAQHGYGIQVPSGLLEPASSLNYELGLKLDARRWVGEAVFYYSDLSNFPVALPTTYNGQDWYDWNHSGARDLGEDTFVISNAAKAYVLGTELELRYALGAAWSVTAGFAYSYGWDITTNDWLRHTIPPWGVLKIAWQEPRHGRLWLEASSEAAGAFDRIPSDIIERDPGYRTNPQDMASPLIGPGGRVPGWFIVNFRSEYALNLHVLLHLAIENITDEAYRRVHSRWDEPGRNVIVGMTITM